MARATVLVAAARSDLGVRSLAKEEAACRQLAASQYGCITRKQALRLGMTDAALDRRVRNATLLVVLPGTYRFAAAPESRLSHLMAIQLWAGADAFFSHRTGAALLDLDGVRDDVAPSICTYVPLRHRGVDVHRLRLTDRPRLRVRDGCRIAGVERVLLDMAAVAPYSEVGRTMDDALRRRLTTLSRLHAELDVMAARGRNGIAAFRKLLEIRDD